MGCASSTPMVQTAGSDMLKAATHVADDATKTAEDAVQDVKESLGKTLDTAKETVATTVEEVKHEVDSTLKEKAGQLDGAKRGFLEKLHLGSSHKHKENITAAKEATAKVMPSVGEMESTMTHTDTETDSLKTSTPEPEIERAMANTKTHRNDGNGNGTDAADGNDSPPTPIPTYSELENLSNEMLSQQSHKAVNDSATNDPSMMTAVTAAENSNSGVTTTTTMQTKKRDERFLAERALQRKLIQQLQEEKRPGTTDWEKYADTLARFRKFNPHDAFRRNGTLTKFGAHPMAIRDKALFTQVPDDDSSDSLSNRGRTSPARRSSARLGGRKHKVSSRPNSATLRSAHASAAAGRKFDYNPNRTRVVHGQPLNNVSPDHIFSAYRQSPSNGTHLHTPTLSPSPPPKHESVKSHPEMRSQHSHLGTYATQRLESLQQQQYERPQYAPHSKCGDSNKNNNNITQPQPSPPTPPTPPTPPPQSQLLSIAGGSSMPPDAIHCRPHHVSPLTRESSNTSLSSQHSHPGQIRSFRSTYDLTSSSHKRHTPVRNTSSFLSTPRTSPFSLTKSYTDLYFSSSSNKENNVSYRSERSSLMTKQRFVRDKSPYGIREQSEGCSTRKTLRHDNKRK